MPYDKKKRQQIIELRKQIATLESKEQELLAELQAGCTHEAVAECEGIPPIRICTHCGLEEEGNLYKQLKAIPVRKHSSKDARYEYRKLLPLVSVDIPAAAA